MLCKRFSMGVMLLFFYVAGLDLRVARASTTVDYTSSCKYFDAIGILQVDTTCRINTGSLGAGGGARYIVSFPNQTEVVVYIYQDGKAETNGIPSDIAIAGGNVVIATDEGEIFIFRSYNR